MTEVQQKELEEDLLDYEEEEDTTGDKATAADGDAKEVKKGHYVGIHASGFRDFILKVGATVASLSPIFSFHPMQCANVYLYFIIMMC